MGIRILKVILDCIKMRILNSLIMSRNMHCLAQAKLPHQSHKVVEELLLDNLPILPVCNSAKLHFKFLISRWDRFPARTYHWPFLGSCEYGYRTCPVALAEKHHIRIILDTVVRK